MLIGAAEAASKCRYELLEKPVLDWIAGEWSAGNMLGGGWGVLTRGSGGFCFSKFELGWSWIGFEMNCLGDGLLWRWMENGEELWQGGWERTYIHGLVGETAVHTEHHHS